MSLSSCYPEKSRVTVILLLLVHLDTNLTITKMETALLWLKSFNGLSGYTGNLSNLVDIYLDSKAKMISCIFRGGVE